MLRVVVLAPMNPPFVSPYDATTGEEPSYIPLLNITTPKHTLESLVRAE